MSYVVHLWQPGVQAPLPTSLAQAEATLRELRQQLRFEPDPAAGTLLAAIAAALPTDGDAADWWREPPEADAHALVLSLAPAVAELTVVLPAIEAAARRLGWVVFDPQAGEARLPSGQVLGRGGSRTEPAPELPPPADIDSSRTARKAWLHQSLTPVFTRRGWRGLKGEFCFGKKLPCAQARVYSNMTGHVSLSHGLWLGLKLPARLQPALNSDGGPSLKVSLLHFAQQHGLALHHEEPPAASSAFKSPAGSSTYELPFATAEQARRCRDELTALYDGPVLDWLDTLTSLQDLDHWANRVPDADCPFVGLRRRGEGHMLLNYHPDLLLAAAVEAPDFEQRARERVALYEANAFGRGLLPQLRQLLAVCGLNL